MNKVEQFFKKSKFPFILFICWALWLSHQIWYLHSLLSLLLQETGTEECTSEALKAAVAVKGHRRWQDKVKRENPKWLWCFRHGWCFSFWFCNCHLLSKRRLLFQRGNGILLTQSIHFPSQRSRVNKKSNAHKVHKEAKWNKLGSWRNFGISLKCLDTLLEQWLSVLF